MTLRIDVQDYKRVNWFYFKLVKKTTRYVYFTPRERFTADGVRLAANLLLVMVLS